MTDLGGVPAADITVDGIEARHVVLYFHGSPIIERRNTCERQ